MRTAAKRDTPERAIIAAAESLGAVVLQVSGVGLPDTLVLHKGRVYLVEVKRQGKPLTDAQDKTFKRITASGAAVYVVETPERMAALLKAGGLSTFAWAPGSRPVEGKTKREHRPGYDRARTLAECCPMLNCSTSRLPNKDWCKKHDGPPISDNCCTCGDDNIPFCAFHVAKPRETATVENGLLPAPRKGVSERKCRVKT